MVVHVHVHTNFNLCVNIKEIFQKKILMKILLQNWRLYTHIVSC